MMIDSCLHTMIIICARIYLESFFLLYLKYVKLYNMLIELFPFWVIAVMYFGIGLSIISSSIVLFSLLNMRHKDFSTELRKYSTLNDILTSLFLGCSFLSNNLEENCILITIYNVAFSTHGFWAIYMSLSLYQIICKQKKKSLKNVKYAMILCIFSGGWVVPSVVIMRDIKTCAIKVSLLEVYLLTSVTYNLPQFVIFVLMVFFYWKIKQVLAEEIQNCESTAMQKRDFFFRIAAYPIIYFVAFSFNILFFFQLKYPEYNDLFAFILIVVYSYYPLANAIFYGYTKSSKRNLRSVFRSSDSYAHEEDILNELRNTNYILPRVYLDLIDQAEDDIFS